MVGELRWIDPPWHYKMSPTDHQLVFGTMYWLDVSSKLLGLVAVVWAGFGVWKTRTRFAKIVLAVAILALLVSFVP